MAEQQLERSILERKERDELHAIASAMSLTPAPRSKKSDIIDLILQATGVDVDGDGATNGDGSSARTTTLPTSGGAIRADGAELDFRTTKDEPASEVAMIDSEDIPDTSDPAPKGEYPAEATEVATIPRDAPRGADGDTAVDVVSAEEDLDGLRPRPADRRPPRGGVNREPANRATATSTRRTGAAAGAGGANAATCSPARRSRGRASSSP